MFLELLPYQLLPQLHCLTKYPMQSYPGLSCRHFNLSYTVTCKLQTMRGVPAIWVEVLLPRVHSRSDVYLPYSTVLCIIVGLNQIPQVLLCNKSIFFNYPLQFGVHGPAVKSIGARTSVMPIPVIPILHRYNPVLYIVLIRTKSKADRFGIYILYSSLCESAMYIPGFYFRPVCAQQTKYNVTDIPSRAGPSLSRKTTNHRVKSSQAS